MTSDDNVVFRGRGDDVIQFSSPVEGLQVFRIQGGSNREHFSVSTLDAGLQDQELLVNVTERYSGSCLAGTQDALNGLRISAEGAWSIEVLGPSDLPVLEAESRGRGDVVLLARRDLGTLDAAKVVRVEASASGNVSMWTYGGTVDLLINVIGPYAGSVIIPQGCQLVAFTCDGQWLIAGR